MDRRFVQVDNRFIEMETSIETRFVGLEASIETRFVELGTNMTRLFSDFRLEMHGEIGDVRGDVGKLSRDVAVFHNTQKLHSWMFALLITGIFTPILQNLFL